jgi:hypothetical protein
MKEACPRLVGQRIAKSGPTTMTGKDSKLAATTLSALLYTQVFLCATGITFVIVRDHTPPSPVFVTGHAALDAPRVN